MQFIGLSVPQKRPINRAAIRKRFDMGNCRREAKKGTNYPVAAKKAIGIIISHPLMLILPIQVRCHKTQRKYQSYCYQ